MEREVRYCTTEDGVRIAYTIEGSGYPLVWCPVFVESFSVADQMPAFKSFVAELTRRWTVVRYDPRGVGLSDRDVADQSNRSLVRDIEAVVEASGFDRVAVWGNPMSGPRGILFAAIHPDTISHLILYDTFADMLGRSLEQAGLDRPEVRVCVTDAIVRDERTGKARRFIPLA